MKTYRMQVTVPGRGSIIYRCEASSEAKAEQKAREFARRLASSAKRSSHPNADQLLLQR